MIATQIKRFTHPFARYLSTSFLLIALILNSIPFSTALASTPKAPLPGGPSADTSLSIDPDERTMIGEDFNFSVSLDNAADTGYGPFIDLILPSNGADGAAGTGIDGITFVSAKYDDYTLPATVLPFPAPDPLAEPPDNPNHMCVSHPLAVDATGTPVQVCGTAGDTLVVLELPFSSVTVDMPAIYASVTAHVSELADVGTPLTIQGRGGYRFGADNLNNPTEDPAILTPSSTDGSGWPNLQVTPQVIAIEKNLSGKTADETKECPYVPNPASTMNGSDCYGEVDPVYESVSGPNFPRQYDINIYVAAGQTVNNLDVTDLFPNNLAFLSVDDLGGGTLVDSPTVGVAANAPDNDLIVHFDSLTGTTDILMTFFIPEFYPDGITPILDPTTGASVTAVNTATALGDWTPIDPRDTATPGNATDDTSHTLNIRSIAVQKSVEIADDTGPEGYSAGDILKYTLSFQISDYFGFGNLTLTDVLTDGQRFDNPGGDFPPTFSVSDRNTVLTDQNFIYTPPPGSATPADDLIIDESQIGNSGVPADGTDGSTTLTFDISKAMTNAGEADGILQGGEAGGTGVTPGTTGTITFYAQIQEDFSDTYPSGDSSVDNGDVLFNSVTIQGSVLNESDLSDTGNDQTDASIQKIKIVSDCLKKDIYAVNGSTTFTPEVQPGDTITFRLRQDLPSSDSDHLLLTDFLPLPLFDATLMNTTITTAGDPSAPPATDVAQYGPENTLAITPTITADATNNSLTFDFGSFDDPADATTKIDILFTVTVSNAPYVDGAVLTNLAQADEQTTNNGDLYSVSGARFTLKEPGISLRKGVVASDNPAAVFVPDPPAPITFNAPGSNPSWSGTIASGDNDPSTALINSDVQNVESGNILTFAIVIENLGHSSLGAFDVSVKDTLPTGLEIPAGGINIQARRGDGADVTFASVGGGTGLFDLGIIIDDESASQIPAHVFNVYDPTPAADGKNLIVITYDLQLAADLTAGTSIVNTATLLSYAGTEGGPNHVGVTSTPNIYTDDATVTLPDVAPIISEGTSVNVTMSEDNSPLHFALTLHATDANGDPLTWSIASPATYGTAGINAGTGVVSYTPYLNYNGPDAFVVQVSDGVLTDAINVKVNVKSVLDHSPLIWNQNYGIQYDTWVGAEDVSALSFASGYRKSRTGAFTMKFPKSFTGFTWFTYRGPDQGKAKVYVDGVLKKTIDLYSATAQWQYPVEIKGLKNKVHTVVIKPMNTRNPASSDKWVVVDGFKIGATTYDDDFVLISQMYSYSNWLGVASPGPRFKAYRISSAKGASMKFSFTGTRFNWVTARGSAYGKARIYVDGVPVKTVDLYNASQQWQYRVAINNLTYGNHVVEIKVLHVKNASSTGFGIVADGFEID